TAGLSGRRPGHRTGHARRQPRGPGRRGQLRVPAGEGCTGPSVDAGGTAAGAQQCALWRRAECRHPVNHASPRGPGRSGGYNGTLCPAYFPPRSLTMSSMPDRIPPPALPTTPKQRRYWTPPYGSARALVIAEAARAHPGLLVAVTRDNLRARALEAELEIFASDLPVLHFPDWETLPYEVFSPHPAVVSQRIATLYRLPGLVHGMLVVPMATLMQRIAPRSHIAGAGLMLDRGQTFDLAEEQRRMQAAGYRHVPQVGEPGEFAVRGALVDIFPMGAANPYRVELLDDEIDSIRSFDPETQRSQQQVDSVQLLPAREFPTTQEAAKAFRGRLRERFPIDPRHCPLYQDMKAGVTPGGIEYYLPLFFPAEAPPADARNGAQD